MSTFVFQIINMLILVVFIFGIPLFMFIVLKSLKRIEKRLEGLETNFGSKEEQ
ncbi:MAG: hypothetical protein SCL54_17305 [Bacillota bacterium]|nr:hypothetical protein [Bacillota bacterium]